MTKPVPSDTPRVGLLANPAAGKGQGEVWHAPVLRALTEAGLPVADLTGASAAESLAAARAAVTAGDIDALVVIGGDGMVFLGVNACAGSAVPLGVIPVGTGNDSATALGLSRQAPEATEQLICRLRAGAYRTVDAGRVRTADGAEHWYLAVLSLGFDAVVSERANRLRWPTGPQRYNVAVARELPVFRPPRYTIVADGQRLDTRAMLVSIANGPRFGGGMQIAPPARLDDGLLDLVLLRPVPLPEFVAVFPSVFKGTHLKHRKVSLRTARTIEVSCDRPLIAFADGERLGPLPVEVEVVPGAVRLLA